MPGEMPPIMILLANHIAVACLCTNRKLPLFEFSSLVFFFSRRRTSMIEASRLAESLLAE